MYGCESPVEETTEEGKKEEAPAMYFRYIV